MDLIQNLTVDTASYFTVKLIIFLVAVGYVFFALLMNRQISLMNRVLNTPVEKLFSLITVVFIFSGLAIAVLTFISLFS
jgi:glucan phosphoethanolaminetransferase (alkaline phosphatase superfamily)